MALVPPLVRVRPMALAPATLPGQHRIRIVLEPGITGPRQSAQLRVPALPRGQLRSPCRPVSSKGRLNRLDPCSLVQNRVPLRSVRHSRPDPRHRSGHNTVPLQNLALRRNLDPCRSSVQSRAQLHRLDQHRNGRNQDQLHKLDQRRNGRNQGQLHVNRTTLAAKRMERA